MADKEIYTPSSLFSDINFGLDTETTVIREREREGVKLKELYFSAREVGEKRPRGYALLAQNAPSCPLLVIIGDLNHAIEEELMMSFAAQGYSVLMFDYTGEEEGKAKYTFYPQEIEYANLSRAGRHLTHAEPDARATCYFEWAALSHFALSSALQLLGENVKVGLLGVGRGANIVWMQASFDERISACCALFAAGWDAYKNKHKYGDDGTPGELDEERERWLAAISAEAYAKFIEVPMLYVTGSNSQLTDMDRAFDTMARLPNPDTALCCVAPRLSEHVGNAGRKNIELFFDKFLKGKAAEFPKRPQAAISASGGKISVTVTCQKEEAACVEVYVAEGQINPAARNWIAYKAEPEGEGFVARHEVTIPEGKLFAYANVKYKSGFTLSTKLLAADVKELGLQVSPFRRLPIIYDSDMGKDSFTIFTPMPPTLWEILFSDFEIALKKGPGDILGVGCSAFRIATYKVGDRRFAAQDEESFKFDVYSPAGQELSVYAYDLLEGHYHKCKVKLLGGCIWHPVEVSLQSLKSADGRSLKSWESVSMIGFAAESEFYLNNILWI